MTIRTSDDNISIYGNSLVTIYLPRSDVWALVHAIRQGDDADVNDKDLLRRLVGMLAKHLESQVRLQADKRSNDGGSITVNACFGPPDGESIDPHEPTFITLSWSDSWALIRSIQRGTQTDFNDHENLLSRLVAKLEAHLAQGPENSV